MKNQCFDDKQLNDKIKCYNNQRITMAIPLIITVAILILFPSLGEESPAMRMAVFGSILFILLSILFVLPGRKNALLFMAVAAYLTIEFGFGEIHLKEFLLLLFSNISTLFVSMKIARNFIHTSLCEYEAMSALALEVTTDHLTQLLNRNGLEQTLSAAWAVCKRERKSVGFLLIDIDYFKSYNDTLGHLKGDHILKQVALQMKYCFKRECDIIGRIGGDEFLIFVQDTEDEKIVEMAQKFFASLSQLQVIDCPDKCLSVSIGIETGIPTAQDTLKDYYNRADKELYYAKKSGRNCISYKHTIVKNPNGRTQQTESFGLKNLNTECARK
jgi:diguanylate cyclase (GGDEF)-like protein